MRGGNLIARRESSRSKGENQEQTQPTYSVYTWIRTWARKAIVKNTIIFSKLLFQFENMMYFLQWSIAGKRVLSPHVNTSF